VSLYEAKRDSEMLAKYMYENRKFWWFLGRWENCLIYWEQCLSSRAIN
jgi:hypothetical protein